ncbi:glycerophosphodiester phosphodiesterase [Pradoshia sp.]
MKKRLGLVIGLSAAILIPSLQETKAEESPKHHHKIDIVAHRGASGYAPENTIAAFDLAVKMKADYIEIDVQRTKDGKLILIHDTTVDRTTDGTGKVGDLTYKEIRRLDAGSWMSEKYKGEKVPTFEEVLKRYKGKIGILIELKSPELYPGIEGEVAKLLKAYHLDKPRNEKVIVQSFNFDSMKEADQLLPRIPIGVLINKTADTTDAAIEQFSAYAEYYNPSYGLVTAELVTKAHEEGMKVQSWTARSRETVQFLLEMKVDGIITDYPDYVK